MNEDGSGALHRRPRRGWIVFWVALILAVFLSANAHLLVVALESQPECLPHLKSGADKAGQFMAAKSSC